MVEHAQVIHGHVHTVREVFLIGRGVVGPSEPSTQVPPYHGTTMMLLLGVGVVIVLRSRDVITISIICIIITIIHIATIVGGGAQAFDLKGLCRSEQGL